MGRRFSGNGGNAAAATAVLPRAVTASQQVPLQSGSLYTLGAASLLQPVTFTKTGGNANLAVASASGVVSATSALTGGAAQAITGTIVAADGVSIPFSVTLTGAPSVPAAPVLTAVTAPGQVSLSWTDGASNGAAISTHTLYRGVTSGAVTAIASISAASPFVDSGLTNGTRYYYSLSASNSLGEGAQSAQISAVPANLPAAPTMTITAGSAQTTISWTDGSNGGSAITAHKLYRGTSAGGETLVGTITSASPYIDTGLTAGQQYFYRLSAVTAIGEGAQAAEQSVTLAAAATAPALPKQSGLVARWSADAVPAQADNTALAAWSDSINAVAAGQATAAKQPKYRTARLGGKPSVQFSGGAYLTIPRASAPAMVGAVDSLTRTIVVIASNIGTATNGWLFGANTTGSNGPFLTATGARAGTFGTSTVVNGNTVPFADAGLAIVGEATTGGGFSAKVNNVVETFVNGTRVYQHSAAPLSSGTADFSIGARATDGLLPGTFDCYEILVWNTALTPADMVKLQSWACAKYGVTDPLAAISSYQVFDGDSITVGQNASAPEFSYPWLVAQAMGLKLGQWTCTAVKAADVANTLTPVQANRVTALAAATGKRLCVAFGEWYNQAAVAPAPMNNSRAYLAQLKTALPTAKTVLWTSTSSGNETSARSDYNAGFDADHTTNIDGYVAVHTDANIGVMGATSNSDVATYFEAAKIHLTGNAGTCGYRNLANLALPVIQAVYNS